MPIGSLAKAETAPGPLLPNLGRKISVHHKYKNKVSIDMLSLTPLTYDLVLPSDETMILCC